MKYEYEVSNNLEETSIKKKEDDDRVVKMKVKVPT